MVLIGTTGGKIYGKTTRRTPREGIPPGGARTVAFRQASRAQVTRRRLASSDHL